MSFPGRLKPTYSALRSASLRFTRHGRIQNSSTTRATSHTDREGRKLSLETPLDRSFPLPHFLYPFFPLLSSHRYPPFLSSFVSNRALLSLSLSLSLSLFLPPPPPRPSHRTLMLFLDRRPGTIVFACVRGQGARYFRPSPTRNAVPGGVFRHTAMDGGNDEPSPALPRRSFTPRNVAREENRELWHNFRRRRRRTRL